MWCANTVPPLVRRNIVFSKHCSSLIPSNKSSFGTRSRRKNARCAMVLASALAFVGAVRGEEAGNAVQWGQTPLAQAPNVAAQPAPLLLDPSVPLVSMQPAEAQLAADAQPVRMTDDQLM